MTDKMREEFEAAFSKKTASLPMPPGADDEFKDFGGFEAILLESMTEDRAGDTYRNNVFASAWWAWQASRESLPVEWPDRHDYTNPDVAGAAILDCRTAFGKAVKVAQ